ncbi:MAG: 4-hydroxy-tetrahydrodipicolinate reductase [Oscillospiraceae bacterium]|nr:4-hydroxy-tetrahydrodipicolinate reductase [Oscillospiraceae bacterium]
MLKILLNGACGRMGHNVAAMLASREDMRIVAGVDVRPEQYADFPVYADIREFTGEADAVVDFTIAPALDETLAYCVKRGIKLIVATTGHTEAQMEALCEASKTIAVFKSANMSLGVALLADLVRRACRVLGDGYDVEVIEKHHNQKLDAPSGTALMLADAAAEALPYDAEYQYNRHDVRRVRPKNEIGIHSIRGGTIVGEHEVLFAGPDEVISLTHTAQSRALFAAGTVRAVLFLADKETGFYNMDDLVRSL